MVFEQGKRYRFSAKRHNKDMGDYWTWPDEHDGEEVMPVDDTWASTPTLITTVHCDWCEEVEEKKMPTRSIHISEDADGKTIHAVMKQGDKVVRREKAVCAPSDTYEFETGALIAFERLFGKVLKTPDTIPENKPIENKPTYREVKREAKVGDKFVVVGSGHPVSHFLEIGSIATFLSVTKEGNYLCTDASGVRRQRISPADLKPYEG